MPWVFVAANLLYIGAVMTYQAFLAPKIFDWIANAPFGDHGAYDYINE